MNNSTATNHITTTINHVPLMLRVLATTEKGEGEAKAHDILAAFLISQPGVGKTDAVTQFAKMIGAKLTTLVASTLDRLDVAGLPITIADPVLGNVTDFAPMRLMASLSREKNPNGEATVLYFNELNAAPESVYPVLYRLFNERAISGLSLRDNVFLIADGNPGSSASAGRDMQMALRRRFAWLNIDTNIPAWEAWAFENGVDARVISFFKVGAFAVHFNDFDPKRRDRLTYATPASWTKLAAKLNPILTGLPDDILRQTAYAAIVGMEAGVAFAAYMKHMDSLPDIAQILRDPQNAKLPKKADMMGILVGSILQRLTEDPKLLPQAIDLACRMLDRDADGKPACLFPEFAAFMVRSFSKIKTLKAALARCPNVDKLIELIRKNEDLLDGILAADNALVAKR